MSRVGFTTKKEIIYINKLLISNSNGPRVSERRERKKKSHRKRVQLLKNETGGYEKNKKF